MIYFQLHYNTIQIDVKYNQKQSYSHKYIQGTLIITAHNFNQCAVIGEIFLHHYKFADILYKILSMGQINMVFPNYVNHTHPLLALKGEIVLKFSPQIKNLYSELEFFIKEDKTQRGHFYCAICVLRKKA